MRNIIITASVILFLLSGLIIYKSSQIPAFSNVYTERPVSPKSKGPSPELQVITNKPASEEETKKALLEELQSTINRLEGQLADSVKKPQSGAETESGRKEPRILAVLGSGTFKSGQVVISEKLMNAVKDIVRDISAFPDSRVSIEGHTDNKPIKSSPGRPYKDNMDLSFLRAKAIARMIIEQGVPSERISVIGYGDARPIASNETVEGRSQNRRVEVKLIPKDREI
jgi:flagellar motor protein MotB